TRSEHPVDAIIACDMARIARDVEFTIVTQGQLARAGVKALFVYQQFEDSHFGLLHQGATSCECPNVRADKLDPLVMQAVADQIFASDKLEPLLQRVL